MGERDRSDVELRADEDRDAFLNRLIAALQALAEAGIPPDVQELLLYGNPDRGVKPKALEHAIAAALACN